MEVAYHSPTKSQPRQCAPANWTISSNRRHAPARRTFPPHPCWDPRPCRCRSMRFGVLTIGHRPRDRLAWGGPMTIADGRAARRCSTSGGGVLPGAQKHGARPASQHLLLPRNLFSHGQPLGSGGDVRPIVDDGAIIYVNGTETVRYNMPSGPVTYSTMAAVGDQPGCIQWTVQCALLIARASVKMSWRWKCTRPPSRPMPDCASLPASGTYGGWDGSDGDFFTPGSPALAPTNAALASPRASMCSPAATPTQATNLIDGRYGDSSSWSPAGGDTTAIRHPALQPNRSRHEHRVEPRQRRHERCGLQRWHLHGSNPRQLHLPVHAGHQPRGGA